MKTSEQTIEQYLLGPKTEAYFDTLRESELNLMVALSDILGDLVYKGYKPEEIIAHFGHKVSQYTNDAFNGFKEFKKEMENK